MSAYSHGLEKIYAFETINPNSVKQAAFKPTVANEPTPNRPLVFKQPTLPLGPYFQESIPNLRLKEPISALGLTPFALKGLQHRNCKSVEEAIFLLQKDPSSYKGMGQGHIEEISQKIEAFIGKEPFQFVSFVDWESLVRTLIAEIEPKECYIFLSRFQLQMLTQISTSDYQELSRWTKEQIAKGFAKCHDEIRHVKMDFLQEVLHLVSDAFLKPFLRRRCGMSTKADIIQRLEQLSQEKTHFKKIFTLLEAVTTPIQLVQAATGVYTIDHETQAIYQMLVDLAKSYFYKPSLCYPFDMLSKKLYDDCARRHLLIDEHTIQKTLRVSPAFLVQPDERSRLQVSLAFIPH